MVGSSADGLLPMKQLHAMLAGLLILTGWVRADPTGKLLERLEEVTAALLAGEGTLDASKAGLKPDALEDQSKKLEELLARVAEDDGLRTLFVPKGNYRIKERIRLRPRVNLIGEGMGKTVFLRDDEDGYLVGQTGRGDFGEAIMAHLSFRNPQRTLLMKEVENMVFGKVEIEGGIMRFEGSSQILIVGCHFNRNRGKAGYASSECSRMNLLHNQFHSIENGSINLSGHRDSVVAYNRIKADELIDSGYAGIRLPNTATNNLVEHNIIENHGRGLFVLSYSSGNTLRHNVVHGTMYQGVLVQGPNNRIEHNLIVDAGLEAIRVTDAAGVGEDKDGKPRARSIARDNVVHGNRIEDSRQVTGKSAWGLYIGSTGNEVSHNSVQKRFGRQFMHFRDGHGNTRQGNEER